MNTSLSKSSASTRFSVSRAQFSPLGRRTGGTSRSAVTSSGRSLTNSVRLLTATNSRALPSSLVTPESATFPNFWSSGDLDLLQPEVTRYHD